MANHKGVYNHYATDTTDCQTCTMNVEVDIDVDEWNTVEANVTLRPADASKGEDRPTLVVTNKSK